MKKEKKFSYVKYIEKELSKRDELCIKHFPTIYEIPLLKSKGIEFKKVETTMNGIFAPFTIDFCLYTKVQ